jgi:twitching motility protein PilT
VFQERAKIDLNELLKKAFRVGASDVHLRVKSPPILRISGKLVKTDLPSLEHSDILNFINQILPLEKRRQLPYIKDIDVAYSLPGVCRFRVNIFRQRGTFAIVMRLIPYNVPEIDELNLPAILKEIALYQRGLVLVTGTTGSGKSTTLAAMLNELNRKDARIVITIEDPLSLIHI